MVAIPNTTALKQLMQKVLDVSNCPPWSDARQDKINILKGFLKSNALPEGHPSVGMVRAVVKTALLLMTTDEIKTMLQSLAEYLASVVCLQLTRAHLDAAAYDQSANALRAFFDPFHLNIAAINHYIH